MNTTYKILWIDDSEDFYESTEELIMDVVNGNNMLPKIQYYVHYEEFKQEELDKFDAVVFNQINYQFNSLLTIFHCFGFLLH